MSTHELFGLQPRAVPTNNKALANVIVNKSFSGDGGNRTRVREADHTGHHRHLRWLGSRSPVAPTTKLGGASRMISRADRGLPHASAVGWCRILGRCAPAGEGMLPN
jgi:hypothetical protein